MKPGSGNTRNAETRYRICGQCGGKSGVSKCVLPVCSDTYPKTAVNKPRLDEEGENLFDSHRDASFTHIFLYGNTMLPDNLSEKSGEPSCEMIIPSLPSNQPGGEQVGSQGRTNHDERALP